MIEVEDSWKSGKTLRENGKTLQDESDGPVLGRIDKYELVRELGEGGFGAVFLARDTVAKTDVAIKGLPPEVKHNESELENIRENFALVKRLRHPNIVAVTDLHLAESANYFSPNAKEKLRVFDRDTMVVMDYAPGVTLSRWCRRFPSGKAPLDRAVAVAKQVAGALDYAHGQDVIHRDVKPANVMVETADDGRLTARVLDFGLAAEIRSSMGRVSKEVCDTSGTRPYMAPEQWLGKKQGPATDQYSLAVLFYELAVGEVPFASVFDCGDTAVMRLAVTNDEPDIPADLPRPVRLALAKALAKKPEERFSSCGEFVAALEGKANVASGAAGLWRGGRAALLAAALGIAALVGGVVWWWHHAQRQNAERREQERVAAEQRLAAEKAAAEKAAAEKAAAEKAAAEKTAAEKAAAEKAAAEKAAAEKAAAEKAAAERKAEVSKKLEEARQKARPPAAHGPSQAEKFRARQAEDSRHKAKEEALLQQRKELKMQFAEDVEAENRREQLEAMREKAKTKETIRKMLMR